MNKQSKITFISLSVIFVLVVLFSTTFSNAFLGFGSSEDKVKEDKLLKHDSISSDIYITPSGTFKKIIYAGAVNMKTSENSNNFKPYTDVTNFTMLDDKMIITWWDKEVILEFYDKDKNNKKEKFKDKNNTKKDDLEFTSEKKDNKGSYYYTHNMTKEKNKQPDKFGYEIISSNVDCKISGYKLICDEQKIDFSMAVFEQNLTVEMNDSNLSNIFIEFSGETLEYIDPELTYNAGDSNFQALNWEKQSSLNTPPTSLLEGGAYTDKSNDADIISNNGVGDATNINATAKGGYRFRFNYSSDVDLSKITSINWTIDSYKQTTSTCSFYLWDNTDSQWDYFSELTSTSFIDTYLSSSDSRYINQTDKNTYSFLVCNSTEADAFFVDFIKLETEYTGIIVNTPTTDQEILNNLSTTLNVSLSLFNQTIWYSYNDGIVNHTLCTNSNSCNAAITFPRQGNYNLTVYANKSNGDETSETVTGLFVGNRSRFEVLEDINYNKNQVNAPVGFQIKLNISSIPISRNIYKSLLWVYIQRIPNGNPDQDARIWRIDNQTWVESMSASELQAQSQVNQTDTYWIETIADDTWISMNVTQLFSVDYDDSNLNFTLRIEDVDSLVSSRDEVNDDAGLLFGVQQSGDHLILEDREDTFLSGQIPYLNVTYYSQNTAPIISVLTTNNSNFTTSTPNISYNYTDDNEYVSNISLYINGAVNQSRGISTDLDTNLNLTTESLSDGTYTYFISVTDSDGEVTNSSTYTFTIDSTAPTTTATKTSPADGASYTFGTWTSNNVKVTLDAIDSGIGFDSLSYPLYCLDTTNNCTPNTYIGPGVTISTEGTSYIRFYSNDSLNNSETIQSGEIKIDTTIPTVTIISPADTTNTTDTGLDVNYTAVDDTSEIENCWWTNDSGVTNYSLMTETRVTSVIYDYNNDEASGQILEWNSQCTFRVFDSPPTSLLPSGTYSDVTSSSAFDLLDGTRDTATYYGDYLCAGSDTQDGAHRFNFTIAENISSIVSLNWTMSATFSGESPTASIYLWNNITSSWVEYANNIRTTGTESYYNGTSPEEYITNNNEMLAIITGTISTQQQNYMRTDYVSLNITYNKPSCGNLTDVTWNEGDHTVQVYANNSNGDEHSASVSFTIDTTSPIININSPSNNTNSSDSNLNINYTLTETNPDKCWWTNDSGVTNNTITCNNNITSVTWNEGTTNLTIYANDTSGNENSTDVTFTIDTTSPTIQILNTNNTNTTNMGLDINYTVSDSGVGIDSCWWSNDSGVTNTTISNCANLTTVTWNEEITNLIIYVNDTVGNENSSTISFRIDTTAPSLTLLIPSYEQSFSSNVSIPLNYTTSDTGVGIDTCWYNIDGGASVIITDCLNTTFNTTEGNHNITIYVNDSVGNEVSDFNDFSVSLTAPAITLEKPTDNEILNSGTNVNFNFTAIDSGGISTCQLYGNWTGSWALNETITSITSGVQVNTNKNINDGIYKWNVWCNDTSNNGGFSNTNYTFRIDSTFPLIDFDATTSVNNTNTTNTYIFINVSVTELNPSNITFKLFNGSNEINTTTYQMSSSNSNNTITFTNLADAEYTYNVTIVDIAGNSNNTNTRLIRLDDTAPSLTILSPLAQNYGNNTNVTLNYSTSDNIVGLDTCWYSIKNCTSISGSCIEDKTVKTTTTLSSCSNSSFNLSTGDTNYKLSLYSRDLLGQTTLKTVTFGIRTDSPAVVLTPTNDTHSNSLLNNIFNFTTSTNADNISNCSLYGNFTGSWLLNQTITSPVESTETSFTGLNLTEGDFIWNVKCSDNFGTSGWALNNLSYTTDITKPNISIISISTTEGSQTFNFNTSVNDTNSVTCKYSIYDTLDVIDGLNENISFTCNSVKSATVTDFDTYTLVTYAEDKAGNENSTNYTFTVSPTSSTPASPGGGQTIISGVTALEAFNYSILSVTGNKNIDVSLSKDSVRERRKDFIIVNNGIDEIEIEVICDTQDVNESSIDIDICDYVEFSQNLFKVSASEENPSRGYFTILTPENVSLGDKFYFNILAVRTIGIETKYSKVSVSARVSALATISRWAYIPGQSDKPINERASYPVWAFALFSAILLFSLGMYIFKQKDYLLTGFVLSIGLSIGTFVLMIIYI